jgi:diamine N-acetyltransferase
MISIVRLGVDDAAMLSKVGGVSLVESHGHSATPEIMQEYVNKAFSEEACRAELEDNRNIFYAVYYNNQPAGYYKIIPVVPHPAVPLQPVTKMERLYLLKEFYDLKLGHHLLQHAVEQSKAAGEKGMWLNVWKENGRALRFYQKQGFEVVGESQFVLTAEHSNPNWVMLLRY